MPPPIRQIVRVEVEAPGYGRTLDDMNERLEKNASAAGKLDQSLKGVGQGAAPGVQATTSALTAQQQATAAANAEYERLRAEIVAVNAALASARKAYNGFGAEQKQQRAEAAANIASLENERRQLQGLASEALKGGRAYDTMGQATGSASSVLIESGRIVNDLSAGAFGGFRGMLIAVSNNFEGFITRGQAFVRASGGWRGAARSLVTGFMGPAGLAFALQAAATAFVLLGARGSDSMKKIGDEAEKQRDRVRGFIDSVLQLQGLDFETGVVLSDPGQLRQLAAADQARLESARNRLDAVKEEREELLRLQRTASQAQGRAVTNVSGQIFSSADERRLRRLTEEQTRLSNAVAQAEASYEGTREQLERVNRQTERRNQLLGIEGAKTIEQVRAEDEARRAAEAQGRRDLTAAERAAEAAEAAAQRRAEAEGLVVEAQRQASTQQLIHENALAQERLGVARQNAEERAAAVGTEAEARRTAFLVAEEFDRRERTLTMESIRLREKAAQEAANAELEQAQIRARAIEDAAERAAVVAAATEQAAQAGTAAARQAVQERERLDAEMTARSIARARDLSDAQIAELQRVSEVVAGGFGGFAEVLNEGAEREAAQTRARFETLARTLADDAARQIREVEAELASGAIGQDAARAKVAAIRESAREAVRAIAAELVRLGLMTEEIAQALDGLADAGDFDEWFSQALADLDAMTRLADDLSRTFQALGDDVLADVFRGLGDVTDAIAEAKRVAQARKDGAEGFTGMAGTLAGLGSFVGVAGAVAGAIGPAFSALQTAIFGDVEANRAAREALEDARRATEANTRALLSGQVGSDVTGDQLAVFFDGLEGARDQVEAIFDGRFWDSGLSEANDALDAFLDRLEDSGLDVAEFRQRFEAARDLSAGARREAFLAILADMEDRFGQIGAALYDYAADFGGAVAQLSDDLRYLGLDGADALAAFLAKLREADAAGALGEGAGAFLDEIEAALDGLDVGSDEFDAALQELYRRIREGEIALPSDMSQADLEALLDALYGLEEAAAGAAAGLRFGQYTDDVAGALQRFADAVRFGAVGAADAVAKLLELLRGQADDLGDFGGLLDAIEGLELDTEAGQAALDALIAEAFGRMEAGAFDFGDLSADEVERLLAALQGLGGDVAALANALGSYADDAEGALAEFADAVRYAGLEGAAAIREWSRLLLASGEDLGGLADLVANAGDMTDAERVAAVAAIWEAIQAGGFDFGTLSDSEARQILDALLGFSDGIEDANRGTQATSISTATVGQVDTLLAYEQEALRVLRAQLQQQIRAADLLADLRARVATALGPAALAGPTVGPAVEVHGGGVTIAGITVHAGAEFTAADVRRVVPEIERELSRRARTPRVNRSLTR